MRRPLLALLLVAPLVGCATDPGAPATPSPADEAAAQVLPWSLSQCRYIVGFTPVEESALAPHIPEGFTLDKGPVVGGLLLERVSLGLEAFVCERGSGLEGEVERMEYGSIFVAAMPPEHMIDENSSLHMLKWDVLVPDAPRREALRAVGLPVYDGSATVEDHPGGVRRGVLTLDGIGTFVLEMVATQTSPASTEVRRFTEYTPAGAGAGFGAWRTDYAWDSDTIATGRGTTTWPDGSWAADVVGQSPAPSTFHAGTWSFTNGTIELPAR